MFVLHISPIFKIWGKIKRFFPSKIIYECQMGVLNFVLLRRSADISNISTRKKIVILGGNCVWRKLALYVRPTSQQCLDCAVHLQKNVTCRK